MKRTRNPDLESPKWPVRMLEPKDGVKVLRSEALERLLAEKDDPDNAGR